MKPLKKQFDSFVKASAGIDLNQFYYLEITEYQMKIQGDLNPGSLEYCKNLTEMIEDNSELGSYIEGNYNGIRIILL